jgi:acyl carrier protein phosphodiesterase
MNYLAHLFLSKHHPEIIIGNMLEDFISGNIEHPRNIHLSVNIKKGIKLHRLIDTLTDTHLEVKKAKKYFYEDFGKYSPIIIDVLFDHYIIKHWDKFSEESFENFRRRIYTSLELHQEIQPDSMKNLIKSMIHHDWLKNYSEVWGLEKAFEGLNKKIGKKELDLKKSIPIFENNYTNIENNFLIFFPELIEMCEQFLKENLKDGE